VRLVITHYKKINMPQTLKPYDKQLAPSFQKQFNHAIDAMIQMLERKSRGYRPRTALNTRIFANIPNLCFLVLWLIRFELVERSRFPEFSPFGPLQIRLCPYGLIIGALVHFQLQIFRFLGEIPSRDNSNPGSGPVFLLVPVNDV